MPTESLSYKWNINFLWNFILPLQVCSVWPANVLWCRASNAHQIPLTICQKTAQPKSYRSTLLANKDESKMKQNTYVLCNKKHYL